MHLFFSRFTSKFVFWFATGPATPHYNSAILVDMLFESHLHHLHKGITDCPGMKDAVVLLKVWLYQRGMLEVEGTKAVLVLFTSLHLLTPPTTQPCNVLFDT